MRLFIFICRLIEGQAASRAKDGWACSHAELNVSSFNEFAGQKDQAADRGAVSVDREWKELE